MLSFDEELVLPIVKGFYMAGICCCLLDSTVLVLDYLTQWMTEDNGDSIKSGRGISLL